MKRARGFTLIELMIVVGIVAILAAVAMTSYSKQIRKTRRADAKQTLAAYALKEEKYRSNHAGYSTSESVLLNGGTAPTMPYYNLTFTTPSGNCNDSGPTAAAVANSFRITATAKLDQLADTACTPLIITSMCGQVTKTPTACW